MLQMIRHFFTARRLPREYIYEFIAQRERLLELDYPRMINLSRQKFLRFLNPLEKFLSGIEPKKTTVPFLIVIPFRSPEAARNQMIAVGLDWKIKHGEHSTLTHPIATNAPPRPYLMVEVDIGPTIIHASPFVAMKKIKRNKRHGLSLAEGIAVLTQRPETLKRHPLLLTEAKDGHQGVLGLFQNIEGPWINYYRNEIAMPSHITPSFKARLVPPKIKF